MRILLQSLVWTSLILGCNNKIPPDIVTDADADAAEERAKAGIDEEASQTKETDPDKEDEPKDTQEDQEEPPAED